MIVESANPAHSLADSQRFAEAFEALELVVVIDVAMTETHAMAQARASQHRAGPTSGLGSAAQVGSRRTCFRF
jgi:hypothetical protein